MQIEDIQCSYARWAPIYDRTFGAVTRSGRRRTVRYINQRHGTVLEVGVGTGLSLEQYSANLSITGIDYSAEMLSKAIGKVERMKLDHIRELRQMDARALDFPDNHFDTVAAMHVLSVVPEPERVMAQMARVCKPGGKVVITNHFACTDGPLSRLEKLLSPLSGTIGWHSDFEFDTILREKTLRLEIRDPLPPLGMMTFAVLEKN